MNRATTNTALVKVTDVIEENNSVKTFRVELLDKSVGSEFAFRPGQLAEFAIFGLGNFQACISSAPEQTGTLEFSYIFSGLVEEAPISKVRQGDILGLTGPIGSHFLVGEMQHKNVIFIASGSGLVSLRGLIRSIIELADIDKKVTIIYGANSVAEMVYKRDLADWLETPGVEVLLAVESVEPVNRWKGYTGSVSDLVRNNVQWAEDTIAVVSGSRDMIEEVVGILDQSGFPDENIGVTVNHLLPAEQSGPVKKTALSLLKGGKAAGIAIMQNGRIFAA
ncbi:MAG: hypothetical protein LWX56_15310 [Ignavibacteria bacterium]|nr:hypothetical protein [Ignavibacteria bacterium]